MERGSVVTAEFTGSVLRGHTSRSVLPEGLMFWGFASGVMASALSRMLTPEKVMAGRATRARRRGHDLMKAPASI